MQKSWGSRFAPGTFLLVAGIALCAALPGPGAAPPPKPQAADPPPGDLLIAADTMGDPRFSHAVILILSHDADGALGIVINRPLEEKPIADILAAAASSKDREPDPDINGTIRVFAGGPVQPERGFVVHTTDYKGERTLTVPNIVAMTPTTGVLRDIGHHKGPAKYFFALGYAGWGPGQLDDEIKHHDWFSTPGDPKLIFDDDRDDLWKHALARRTQDL
ncbi:MAG TPA: YqgE/AlgH family protein [Stellaceae bacterium]|jgi:putative transcriptional regulator